MVSSFSNPGFPPVDVHPTRLPAMDARLSAAIDSFEASLRAALRDAIREALDSAFANFTMNFSRDWALLRRDSALRAEGVSDPVPTTSDDTQSIDLGHPGLQGDDNPPRLPSPVQVHSVPPLLSSSPLLRALATPVVKPQSIDSVAAIVSLLGSKTVIPDSVMTTASQLLPDCSASMFSNLCKFSGNEFTPPTFFRKSGAEFMQAQPSMIAHKCQQGLVGMYARYVFDEIPDSCCCVVLDRDMCYCKGIQDKGGGSKFRSPDECRRKLEEKIAKSDYDVSIGCFITKKLHVWCQLPRVLWIRRHEVLRSLIYNLSHGEAKWYWILLFILAYYTGVIVILYEDSLTAKCGWVNWYLVGKFVKKDFYALKLFEEMSKKPLCEKHPMAKFVWSVTNNTGTAEWYNACQEALNNKGTLFHFMLLKTFHLTIHGNSELHIATSWQMLKSFWNASTITDYILEIEFFWEKDIKIVLWVGNATLIFSALESWLVVEHNKRGFAQQWLSLTFSWATSEAVMAKAWSQWYFPYQKTQVPILKAQVKSSSFSPCYRAYHQPYINKKMRAILIDWLIKVHYKFELMGETQFLTVNLIDRFFERQMVIRKQLPLVGVTTMLLACKYEVSVPIVVDFVMKEFDSVFEQLKICMVTLYTHLPTSCNSPREVNDRVKALGHLMSSTIFSPWKAILLEYGFTYVIIELDRFILSRSAMDFDFANMMLFEGRKGPIEMFLREFSSLKQDKPTKPRRHIPQTSEQTMDAPHLIDDYYPNLLVWESCNNLVIALASTIYLWEATNLSALSRIKALDWLGHVDEIVNGPDYKVEFPISDDRLGHPTISLSDATFGYPSGSVLFRNFNFGIALDSRITMVGPNGIGQSKILQLIAGELQPISLTVFHSATVQIALSVSTALRALQPRYMLSGGQRSRDAFAKITTMKLHIILLGEPSNHRDLDVVEALIQGLVLFQGGILTVSNGKHLVSGSMDYKKIPLLQSSWEKSYQPFIHHSDFGNIAIELKTCPFTSVLLQVLMFHNWWSYVSSLAPKVEPSTTLLVSTEEGLVQKVSPQAVLTQQNSHIPSKNNKFTLRLQDSLVNFTANSSRFQVLILTLRTRLFFKGRAML